MAESDKMLESIINKQPFGFDPATNSTYQAYKKEYQALGEKSKADVLGDMGTLYGGDAPDYAQIAAQQGQNTYMQQMSTIIPALEEAAYRKWAGEQQKAQSDYGLMKNMEDTLYGRQRDTVADKQFASEAAWNRSTWNKSFNYGKSRDKKSDSQWRKEFDWKKKMDNREYELKKRQAAKRGRGGSGGVGDGYVGDGSTTGSDNFFKKIWDASDGGTGRRVPGQSTRTGSGGRSLSERQAYLKSHRKK